MKEKKIISKAHADLGNALYAYCVKNHLTPLVCAKELGFHRAVIGRIFRGEQELTYSEYLKIISFIGIEERLRFEV